MPFELFLVVLRNAANNQHAYALRFFARVTIVDASIFGIPFELPGPGVRGSCWMPMLLPPVLDEPGPVYDDVTRAVTANTEFWKQTQSTTQTVDVANGIQAKLFPSGMTIEDYCRTVVPSTSWADFVVKAIARAIKYEYVVSITPDSLTPTVMNMTPFYAAAPTTSRPWRGANLYAGPVGDPNFTYLDLPYTNSPQKLSWYSYIGNMFHTAVADITDALSGTRDGTDAAPGGTVNLAFQTGPVDGAALRFMISALHKFNTTILSLEDAGRTISVGTPGLNLGSLRGLRNYTGPLQAIPV